MLDINPDLRGAYGYFREAAEEKEADLDKIPATHELLAVSYHPNSLPEFDGQAKPWLVMFVTQIEEHHFVVGLRSENVYAQRARKPLVEVREGDAPLLMLPEGYRLGLCTASEWDCMDQYLRCPMADQPITRLQDKPKLIIPN